MNWYIKISGSEKPYKITKEDDIEIARTLNGLYIGSEEDAKTLFSKRNLDPYSFDSYENSDVACVAYDLDADKWIGWSHRAISEFPSKKQAMNFAEVNS